MLRVLQAGGLLGIVADLNVQGQEGVFVNFFGIPASTTTGLARLAMRTEAAVIPGFFVWDKQRQKYLLKIEPPLEITRTGDDAEDVRALTQKATAVIEKYIRAYPEQWLWIHKRWNTRPPGEASLYVKTSEPKSLKFSEQT
jgi:KDO2-lipid IV(A) lauroyltransferase